MISSKFLIIPTIEICKSFNDDLDVTYYELYLNHQFEGRYQSISDIHWRLGLILSEQALATEV